MLSELNTWKQVSKCSRWWQMRPRISSLSNLWNHSSPISCGWICGCYRLQFYYFSITRRSCRTVGSFRQEAFQKHFSLSNRCRALLGLQWCMLTLMIDLWLRRMNQSLALYHSQLQLSWWRVASSSFQLDMEAHQLTICYCFPKK